MAILRYICVHHSGGFQANPNASTQHLTVRDIDNAHRDLWPDFKSSLGYYVGYNFVITKDGVITQTRALGTETAAQKGHNFDTVSICLVGNFSGTDNPTYEQVHSLKNLCISLIEGRHKYLSEGGTRLELSFLRIHPHRVLQPNHTECYGTRLTDNWAKDLVQDYFYEKNGIYAILARYGLLFNRPKVGRFGLLERDTECHL